MFSSMGTRFYTGLKMDISLLLFKSQLPTLLETRTLEYVVDI